MRLRLKLKPKWLLGELRHFPGLTRLSAFRFDRLSSIPEEIFKLSALTYLDLSFNTLSSLSSSIGRLTHLQRLDLYDNMLTTLPIELNQLTELTEFFIANNPIEIVPEELQNSPIAVIRNEPLIRAAKTIPRVPAAILEQPPLAVITAPAVAAIEQKPAPAIAIAKPEESISLFQQLTSCFSSLLQQIYLLVSRLFAFLRIST